MKQKNNQRATIIFLLLMLLALSLSINIFKPFYLRAFFPQLALAGFPLDTSKTFTPDMTPIIAQASIPTKTKDQNAKILPLDFEYAANFSDDKILVGASHNIFVGKVIRQTGSQGRGFGPETQFSVEIISNVKGDLEGMVTVDQFGGYDQDGMPYVMEDAASLLQPGGTYVLATRYNAQEDWYTLNSFPAASQIISQDDSLNTTQLEVLASENVRVHQLESAYPHEVLLAADVQNNNARNSYASLSQLLNDTSTASSSMFNAQTP